jgi:membrane protein implicated in regulation of membrane protease activity
MFGFSFLKLLFTVAVVVIVWQGYKWVGRLQNQRTRADKLRSRRGPPSSGGELEDMVKCRVCGSYVAAAGATACERGDCPYPG